MTVAAPTVSYTFANSTTADATHFNQNFTDLIDALTDGLKTITAASFVGNLTGNASTVTTNANLTGDCTSVGNATTLATVNSNVGSFGSATQVATVTVNAKGLVTAASSTTIALAASAITSGTLATARGGTNANSSAQTGLALVTSGTWTWAALSGDITSSAHVTTLATVNGNVGSFGSSTSIPSFTVNAKGLITAASGNVVVAPAGTLTGTTLAANVVTSSLTSVGTIGTGTWQGTAVGATYGGTGGSSAAATGVPKVTAGVWSYPTLVAVADGGTGLASGTSGGLLYYSAAGTIASSGAYTANRVLYGGGAGAAPGSSANFTFDGSGIAVGGASAGIAGYVGYFVGSTAGQTQVVQVRNTDNTNSASNAKLHARTAGASGGDPFVQFDANGAFDWAVGLDNSDSLKFKISRSAALGTADRFTIASDGQMTVMGQDCTSTAYAYNTTGTASSTKRVYDAQYTVDTDCTGGYFYTCLNSSGTVIGRVEAASNTTVSYTTSSDERMKEKEADFDALAIIAKLRPLEYQWKGDTNERREFGLFAQELYRVLPGLVSVGNDDLTPDGSIKIPWAVDYPRMVPVLLRGVQMLMARIERLENR